MRILLISLLILSYSNVKAQTKVETLDWIASKLVKYGGVVSSHAKNIDFDRGSIVDQSGKILDKKVLVRIVMYDSPDVWDYYYAYDEFLLNDVSNVVIDDRGLTFYTFKGEIEETTISKAKNSNIENTSKSKLKATYVRLDWNAELDLKNRMSKAIAKLLEYNNITKVEAY